VIYHYRKIVMIIPVVLSILLTIGILFSPSGGLLPGLFALFFLIISFLMCLLGAVLVDEDGISSVWALGQKKLKTRTFIPWEKITLLGAGNRLFWGARHFGVASKEVNEWSSLTGKGLVRFTAAFSGHKKIIEKVLSKVPKVDLTPGIKDYLESVN